MTDENRIAPNYQEMAQVKKERPQVENAASATQEQLLEMNPGERWAHEAAQDVERVGGNQGHFAAEHAVTDRELDYDGEFGYPTPT